MNNIKLFRQRLGLTQKDLSNAIGSSQQTIARWEKDNSAIPSKFINKLAVALKTTNDQILNETIDEESLNTFDNYSNEDRVVGDIILTIQGQDDPMVCPVSNNVITSLTSNEEYKGLSKKRKAIFHFIKTMNNQSMFINKDAIKMLEFDDDSISHTPFLHEKEYKSLTLYVKNGYDESYLQDHPKLIQLTDAIDSGDYKGTINLDDLDEIKIYLKNGTILSRPLDERTGDFLSYALGGLYELTPNDMILITSEYESHSKLFIPIREIACLSIPTAHWHLLDPYE